MTERAASPFSPRTVLGMVVVGGLAFIAFLWLIGAGMTGGNTNNGQATVGGKGLTGYAAMADYLEARGYAVSRVQSKANLKQGGLLVLTPPGNADAKVISRIVEQRRRIGPTLVILPKWITRQVSAQESAKAQPGWTALEGAMAPGWGGFHDAESVEISPMRAGGRTARWTGGGTMGELPNSESVMSAKGDNLIPLVTGDQDGRMLAGYAGNDGGMTDSLDAIAQTEDEIEPGDDDGLYPLVFVYEPDLVNNYGFGDAANARLAERLVQASLDGAEKKVMFDLTLNGFARSQNLLTLAFTPPFLAATLCLLLAALVTGWRAFNRFGPPRLATRTLAFGKRALVSNAAGLVRRTGRLYLVAPPYADRARERLARALALPQRLDPEATEQAIDRALAARAPQAEPFSQAAARLRAARSPRELLRAAQALHSLERTLIR
nr:DUF4350 domain-containing protein [Novosphingobium sp. B 225]